MLKIKLNIIALVVCCPILLAGLSCNKNYGNDKNNKSDNIEIDSVLFNPTSMESDFDSSQRAIDFLPTSTTSQIIKHAYYTLSYNESYEQAEWVYYTLKKENIKSNNFTRPFFIADTKVSTGSADWRNFKNSGYDKGHLCPAGDMEFDQNAYNDTFLTSNISPQLHSFNEGIWNRLEQQLRIWAKEYDCVYIATAGVLKANLRTIGTENVSVPEYFYKVVMRGTGGEQKMIAFLVPNKESNAPLEKFVVSVDLVEEQTGIDFFPQLPDSEEDELEEVSSQKGWTFFSQL